MTILAVDDKKEALKRIAEIVGELRPVQQDMSVTAMELL